MLAISSKYDTMTTLYPQSNELPLSKEEQQVNIDQSAISITGAMSGTFCENLSVTF